MRVKVLRTPTVEQVDGIDLRRFFPGYQYEVGNTLAALLLAEGWAEPVTFDKVGVLVPVGDYSRAGPQPKTPSNLVREFFPPYYDTPAALAADRRRRPRRR